MMIGILALQGAFAEHEQMLERLGADYFEIRQKKDLERDFDAFILPGGESTVMGKLLHELDMFLEIKEKIDAGYKVGIICTDESRSHYPEGEVRSIGARKSQASVAHNLYALLREFDDLKVDYIYSESFSQDHLGQAIMNRLSKAAGYQIYKV